MDYADFLNRMLEAERAGAKALVVFMDEHARNGEGWKVLYLGADLPAEDIARAARNRGLDAVGLSIVLVADARQTLNTLEDIRKALPESTLMLVGGSGARPLENKLRRLSIEPAEDLDQLIRLLRERRAAGG